MSISDIVNDEYPMPCSDDDSSDIKVRFFMSLTKSPESDWNGFCQNDGGFNWNWFGVRKKIILSFENGIL